jgi:hypothetical protein
LIETLLKSSAQDEIAIAQTWKAVVDAVLQCKSESLGRVCIVYDLPSNILGYISLFDLQRIGAKGLEMDSAIHGGVLREVGSYDFATEFVLLLRSEDADKIRYQVEVCEIAYDGWRLIPEFDNIRVIVKLEQQQAARMALAQMKAARSPKRNKGKRKK